VLPLPVPTVVEDPPELEAFPEVPPVLELPADEDVPLDPAVPELFAEVVALDDPPLVLTAPHTQAL